MCHSGRLFKGIKQHFEGQQQPGAQTLGLFLFQNEGLPSSIQGQLEAVRSWLVVRYIVISHDEGPILDKYNYFFSLNLSRI